MSSSNVSNYSFEKAQYYAFKSCGLKEIAAFTTLLPASVILSSFVMANKVIALSALNVGICTIASAAIPLITLIGLRVLMGYFAEKSYNQANEGNTDKKFELYKWAADHGQCEAPSHVGWMYKDGVGTKANNKKALKYFAQAILRNDKKSDELKAECIKMITAKNPTFKNITIEKLGNSLLLKYMVGSENRIRILARD